MSRGRLLGSWVGQQAVLIKGRRKGRGRERDRRRGRGRERSKGRIR